MINQVSRNNTRVLTSNFAKQADFQELWGCIAPFVNLYKLFEEGFSFTIPADHFQQDKNGSILANWFIGQAKLNDLPITGFIRNFLDDDSVFDGYNDTQIEMIISENLLLWKAPAYDADEPYTEEFERELLAYPIYAAQLQEDNTSFYGAKFNKNAFYKLLNSRIARLCSTALLSYINRGKTEEAITLNFIKDSINTPANESGYIPSDIFDMVFSLTNDAKGFMNCVKLKDCKILEILMDNMPNKALMANIVTALRESVDTLDSSYIKSCIKFIGNNPNSLEAIAVEHTVSKGLVYDLAKRTRRYHEMGVTDVSEMDVIEAIYQTGKACNDADSLSRQLSIEKVVYSTIAAIVVKEVSSRV